MAHRTFGAVLVALVLAGCNGDIQRPNLCVFLGQAGVDPQTESMADCLAQPKPMVADGEAVFVLHETPSQATIDAPVTITIATPCTSSSQSYSENNHRVLFSTVAPPGASCSFAVTATVLNETNTYVTAVDGDACSGKVDICGDAGSADAGTSDSGVDDASAAGSGNTGGASSTMDSAGAGG